MKSINNRQKKDVTVKKEYQQSKASYQKKKSKEKTKKINQKYP